MKPGPLLMALAISALFAVGLATVTQGSFGSLMTSMAAMAFGLAALAAGGAMALWARLRASATARRRSRGLCAIGAVGLVQWLAVPIHNHLNELHKIAARGYVEGLMQEIESFQRNHRRCPANLAELGSTIPVPPVLKGQDLLRFVEASTTVGGQAPDVAATGSIRCRPEFQVRLPGSPPLRSHLYDATTHTWRVID